MAFCPKCKVNLAADAEVCPLCHGPAAGSDTAAATSASSDAAPSVSYTATVHPADDSEPLSPVEQRLILFELLTVSLVILTLATVAIDVLFFRHIQWSQYTCLIIGMLWLCTTMPLIFWARPWLVYAILAPAFISAVFLWALFSGGLSWFLVPALPIVLSVEGAVAGSFAIISVQKRRGLNTVGVVLGAAALICTGIDASIGFTYEGHLLFTWSLVVLFSVIPLAGLFFYLHYRVISRASLRKIFRL